MQKKMIHIQIEKHTEYFTKLLSFDCRTTLNESRNAVNSAFLGPCTIFRQPSLSSKSKILYPHLFSLSRLLWTSFKVLAYSLLSLDIPLFSRLSPWFYTKEKDLIERFFRSTRSLFSRYFIHFLG